MNVAIRFFIAYLLLWSSIAYSNSTISSLFVAYTGGTEVDMLNLVEAPAGHLSGALIVSTFNQEGTRNKDIVRNMTGSIYQDGVSLQIDMGVLEHPQNVVGKLHGNTLSLTFGNNTVAFHQMSQQEYMAVLATLDHSAENQKLLVTARKAVVDLDNEFDNLVKDLQRFVEWGNARVAHVHDVQEWYSNRLVKYQKCSDKIQPLAARHVPSWQWQDCVLTLDNDKYNRDQEGAAITDNQVKERTWEQRLNERIAKFPQRITEVSIVSRSTCALAKDKEICLQQVENWRKSNVIRFELAKPFDDYRSILPKVHKALDDDIKISIDGEQKLSAIAREVDGLYKSASDEPSR